MPSTCRTPRTRHSPLSTLRFCFLFFPLCTSGIWCRVLSLGHINQAAACSKSLCVESPTTTQLPPISDAPALSEAAPPKANCRTPTKRARRLHRTLARNSPNGVALLPPRTFAIGELIWGPARGHPAWPGKIVKMPDGVCTPSQQFDHVWVQWFGGGGRSTSELIPVNLLQSLSEGLEAHHKAQKDTRK